MPTIVDEPTTDACLSLLSTDPTVVVWEGTLIELLSVVGLLRREAEGLDDLCSSIRLDVQSHWSTWARVADWSRVSALARAAQLAGFPVIVPTGTD